TIIGFGARIGPRALVRDGVIGDGANIGARCELLRGARVWPGVEIPDGGIRFSTDV
ncbi:NDP-sugar synthase, partial [Nocardia niwae]